LLTGEYPPQPGGVADYTRLVARGLADAGDTVHVWASRCDQPTPEDPRVRVHRLPDHFGPRSLAALDHDLSRLRQPVQVVLQYAPHAFGFKAMNLPLCLWLNARWRKRYWVMFHEVAFPFRRGQPWRHHLLAAVNHLMGSVLVRGASRLFLSIQQWEPLLRRLAPSLPPCHWQPVPSNLDCRPDPIRCHELRRRLVPDPEAVLVGHFGSFGTAICELLARVLPAVLERDTRRIGLLVGRDSSAFADHLMTEHPGLRGRVIVTGRLQAAEAAHHLAACDLLLQPYPDGASARRGSLMAGLALGMPIVTTLGPLSDSIFIKTDAVRSVPAERIEEMVGAVEALLNEPRQRALMGQLAGAFYQQYFAVENVVRAMRQHAGSAAGQATDGQSEDNGVLPSGPRAALVDSRG
jgi:glycosyltransferase involved in cell wall biosynthesis